MGFAEEFVVWLSSLLTTYIGDNAVRVAGALEPTVVVLGILYVMIWGSLHLMGKIEEPFVDGLKRIVLLAVVLGVALRLWLYQPLLVDTFFQAPGELAAAIVGIADSATVIDQILSAGLRVAGSLFNKGGVLDGDFSFYIAGAAVAFFICLTTVYTLFLVTLSRIAISVLLAIGPLFIVLLLFASTKRFFESWLAQLTNYALITVLTILLAGLMLHLLSTAAQQALSTGGEIEIMHAIRVCMAAGFTFLVMRQVTPIAAGLASGLALSTFGIVSGVVSRALRGSGRATGHFMRGALMDRDTTRYDGLSRKAGYYVKRGMVSGMRFIAGSSRENAIARR